MMKLGAAVIGCGAISKMHLEAILKIDSATLLYAVDTDENRARKAASKYGCSFHTDYTEVLKDPDVNIVHLCTPHYLHAPMAIKAMENGKHVLTEKPMAISTDEAIKMTAVSRKTGQKLGVCFQNRYNPTSVKIKEILNSGKAGRITGARAFVTWHRDDAYYTDSGWRGTWEKEGGGVLINQAIHTLDLLQWFLGDIESIRGNCSKSLLEKIIEVEDTADAVIRFKNGTSAIFYATNCHAENSQVFLELVCSKAVIRLEGDLTIKYCNGELEHFNDTNLETGEKSYWGASHNLLIKDFYRCVLSGEPFSIEGEEGIKALQMVKTIYTSSKSCQWVDQLQLPFK